jgi:hypothetical protein
MQLTMLDISITGKYAENSVAGTTGTLALIRAQGGATVQLNGSSDTNITNILTIHRPLSSQNESVGYCFNIQNAQLNLQRQRTEINQTGAEVDNICLYLSDLGVCRTGSASTAIISLSGTITGRRYDCRNNAICSMGRGAAFFPGTVDGQKLTGAQYS